MNVVCAKLFIICFKEKYILISYYYVWTLIILEAYIEFYGNDVVIDIAQTE